MPEDLPIYSDVPLRTGLQFAELERLKGADLSGSWMRADAAINAYEGASGATAARQNLRVLSRDSLIRIHADLFPDRTGAGELRTTPLKPMFRGQDCAPPEFIEKSLANLSDWLSAESFTQIHPIEQCALALTRVIDIWPFEFGNFSVALVAGNLSLAKADLAPFFVPVEYRAEFEKAIAQAMTIDMQPLVNAIYRTVKKEMDSLAKR